MLIASVNQDRGISPGRAKGAAVHVQAMREAFVTQGADVLALDGLEDDVLTATLEQARGLDLVYERYALGASAAGRFAASRGVPHVMEVNSPLLDEAARHRGLDVSPEQREREREILMRPCALFAVSRAVARWLESQGVPRQRIRVRANAVDTKRFHPGLRADRGGDVVLGFHGRLRPWHGFDMLVELLSRLVARGLPVRLDVVGNGEYEAALAGRVPPDRWRVTPWVPHAEVGRRVARFDVLALTYPSDALCYFSPLKLVEGMACGVVPVVPALGDLPEVVSHGNDGLVYPAGDIDALEKVVSELVTRPELRERLGASAARSAKLRTWSSLAREVIDSRTAVRSAAS